MKKLLVVSVDGLRSEDFNDPRVPLPRIRDAAIKGTLVQNCRTIFPSVTWAIHPAIVAGRSPAATGFFGNTLYDRSVRRMVAGHDPNAFLLDRDKRCDTLFEAFASGGMRVGSVCWPLSQGAAALSLNIPEFYKHEHFQQHTTPGFGEELRAAGLPFDRYAEWSSDHACNPMQDALTRDICHKLLREDRTDILFTHFLTIDSLQHDYGVASPEAHWAIGYVDGLVGSLIDAEPDADLVLFSDHGHAQTTQALHIDRYLEENGFGGTAPSGPVVAASNGGACFIYSLGETDLGQLKHILESHEGISEAWSRDEFGALGLPLLDESGRGLLPDLILEAAPSWYFATGGKSGIVVGGRPLQGMHGYRPERPGLNGFLAFAGPSFLTNKKVQEASLLDIAATLNAVYSLGMSDLEGRDIASTNKG